MQLIYYVFNFLFGSKTTEDNTRDPHSTIFRAWSGNLPQATSVLRVFFSIMGSAESRSVNNYVEHVFEPVCLLLTYFKCLLMYILFY